MRITISLFFILICLKSYGQYNKYKGTWISNTQNEIVIRDSLGPHVYSNSYLSIAHLHEDMNFQLNADTLSFRDWPDRNGFFSRYDFIVLSQSDTSMTLRLSGELPDKFPGLRTNITFVKQEFNKDKSIIFEKLIFHGGPQIVDIEIDSNRNIYFNVNFLYSDLMMHRYTKMDTLKTGQFTGKLNDSSYNELIALLQTCNLKTLYFPEVTCKDCYRQILTIYYNGQRKHLRSGYPPMVVNKLINFLYNLNTKVELTRTNEKRTFTE